MSPASPSPTPKEEKPRRKHSGARTPTGTPSRSRNSRSNSTASKPKDAHSTNSQASKSKNKNSHSQSRPHRRNHQPLKEDQKPIKEETKIEITEKPEKQGCCAGLGTLYNFADVVDIQLMVIGTLLALFQSALPPFVWLVMGDFVSFAIEREVSETLNVNKFHKKYIIFKTMEK